MADFDLATLASQLSTLDLAILSCLIAKQHCLIEAEPEDLDNVEQEIKLAAQDLFGLSSASVSCHSETTPEDFSSSILLTSNNKDTNASTGNTQQNTRPPSSTPEPAPTQKHNIPNIIITKNLSNAPRRTQIQILELIRTNRLPTHTAIHTTPKTFLLIILNTTFSKKLNIHLSDTILLSHYHSPSSSSEEALPHSSSPSPSPSPSKPLIPILPPTEIQTLHDLLPQITLSTEVRSYLISLGVTIRTHRFVKPGSATPSATRDLESFSRCLALLHGLEYVSPDLVALAARRVYRHRLRVLRPDEAGWERSVMYGSSEAVVRELLERLWRSEEGEVKDEIEVADEILEQVLALVEIPV